MIATLCSYENLFGPYHPQTLRMMIEVGAACLRTGDLAHARFLLERATSDLNRFFGRDHEARLRAVAGLRDLYRASGELDKAESMERELFECWLEDPGQRAVMSETVFAEGAKCQ